MRSGDWRALGVTSAERIAAAPEVPTVAEQGFPGFAAAAWFGLLSPAGMPPATIDRVDRGAVAALRAPELQPRLRELGIQPVGNAPAEFAVHIEREIPRMAAVLEEAGLGAGSRWVQQGRGGSADRLPWRGTMGSGRRPPLPLPWPGSTSSRGASAGTDPLRPPA